MERNPVRAALASSPEAYEWSSATAHCTGDDPFRLLDLRFWEHSGGAPFWRQLVDNTEDEEELKRLRRATYAGLPLGSKEFSAPPKRPPALPPRATNAAGAA